MLLLRSLISLMSFWCLSSTSSSWSKVPEVSPADCCGAVASCPEDDLPKGLGPGILLQVEGKSSILFKNHSASLLDTLHSVAFAWCLTHRRLNFAALPLLLFRVTLTVEASP